MAQGIRHGWDNRGISLPARSPYKFSLISRIILCIILIILHNYTYSYALWDLYDYFSIQIPVEDINCQMVLKL
jgi:hypothetical protein